MGRWLWFMVSGGDSYDPLTWGVWLGILAGPLVLGTYDVVLLMRRYSGFGNRVVGCRPEFEQRAALVAREIASEGQQRTTRFPKPL